MSGDAVMQAMIAGLRGLGRDALSAIAKEAAPLVQEAARKTAAAGTTPDGEAWTPTKDGRKPLENAADHITARASGPTLRIYLNGPDVFHHFGTGRVPRRQIIPEGKIPPAIGSAMQRATSIVMGRALGSP